MNWRAGVVSVAAVSSFLFLATSSAQDKTKDSKKVHTNRIVVRDGQVFKSEDGDDDVVIDLDSMRGGFLGISTVQLNRELRMHFGAPPDSGVLVSDVSSGSPAEKAGLKVGDVITGVDGDKVTGMFGVARGLRRHKTGDSVRIDYVRGGSVKQTSAVLAERQASLFKFEMPDMEPLLALRTNPQIPREQLDRTMKKLDTYFNSPEWKARVEKMSDCGQIQGRLQAMEQRMRDLEKRLENK